MKEEHYRQYIAFLQYEKQLSPRTIEEYERDLRFYLFWCDDSGVSPLEATPHEVRGYVRKLSIDGKSKRSVTRAISSLKSFYKWAVMDGFASQDSAYYLIAPKLEKKLPVYLSEAECIKLENYVMQGEGVNDLQRQVVVMSFLYCGIRARELTGLKIKSIELSEFGKPVRMVVFGKGSKERIVPIAEPLREPLKKWLTHRINLRDWDYARKYQRPLAYIQSDYLIPGIEGGEMTYRAINDIVRKACKKAEVQEITPHKLRHTCATNLHRNGVPITIVQKILGHATIATTQIYTHITNKEVEEAVMRANDPLERVR